MAAPPAPVQGWPCTLLTERVRTKNYGQYPQCLNDDKRTKNTDAKEQTKNTLSVGDEIPGPGAYRSASMLGKSLWQLGPIDQLDEKGNVCHGSTHPRTDLATPSPGSGVAELDMGPVRPKGNHLSGYLAGPETDPS